MSDMCDFLRPVSIISSIFSLGEPKYTDNWPWNLTDLTHLGHILTNLGQILSDPTRIVMISCSCHIDCHTVVSYRPVCQLICDVIICNLWRNLSLNLLLSSLVIHKQLSADMINFAHVRNSSTQFSHRLRCCVHSYIAQIVVVAFVGIFVHIFTYWH